MPKSATPEREDNNLAVTKSWEEAEELTTSVPNGRPRAKRRKISFPGAVWLLAGEPTGGWRAELGVFGEDLSPARTRRPADRAAQSQHRRPAPTRSRHICSSFPRLHQRDEVAAVALQLSAKHRPLANIGALAKMWRTLQSGQSTRLRLSRLKPLWIVRSEDGFRRDFIRWIAIYFASFWIVYLAWRIRHFNCDPAILPVVHILTGLGLILMVSLRDPLRDTEEFAKFAKGVAIGAVFLLLPLIPAFDYRRLSRWTYGPLLAAFALFVGLLRFGTGPGASDARVNLGPFQPVEFIKLLLALFLAGYFANKWERLRDLREKRFFLRFLICRASNMPRLCSSPFRSASQCSSS